MQRNPLASRPFHVDAQSLAAQALAAGGPDAAELAVLAGTPQARWVGDWLSVDAVAGQVDGYLAAAERAGALPVLVLYAVPQRDAGGWSAGGLASGQHYAAWLEAVLRGIGERDAGLVLEPDALAGLDALGPAARADRLALLHDAVGRLAARPRLTAYVDVGHAHWLPAAEAADRLHRVGVERVRGFSLNVANFGTTVDQTAYGEQVAALLAGRAAGPADRDRAGGTHYVVDTSRNGLGPPPDGPDAWANPPGRALGEPPTTATGAAHCDAYLWVKRPGESDGAARPGEPPAGDWFGEHAVGLVRRRRPHTR